MPVETPQAQPGRGLAGEAQATLFWAPEALEAVDQTQHRVKEQQVHPFGALEDQAAEVQGHLFSEPAELARPPREER